MGLFQKLYQYWKLARWRKALSLPAHARVFNVLYQDVDGFQLSKEARAEKDAVEYLYGEIEFEPFIALLSLCHPNTDTVFYDLGSGTGKAVLAAAMVYKVRKSCGIEILPALHHAAEKQKHRLHALPAYSQIAKQIVFLEDDFLNTSLQDADIVFINATAYFADYWAKISQHLEQLKPGACVLSSSKAVFSKQFDLVELTEVEMSWGVVRVYVQKHI